MAPRPKSKSKSQPTSANGGRKRKAAETPPAGDPGGGGGDVPSPPPSEPGETGGTTDAAPQIEVDGVISVLVRYESDSVTKIEVQKVGAIRTEALPTLLEHARQEGCRIAGIPA